MGEGFGEFTESKENNQREVSEYQDIHKHAVCCVTAPVLLIS